MCHNPRAYDECQILSVNISKLMGRGKRDHTGDMRSIRFVRLDAHAHTAWVRCFQDRLEVSTHDERIPIRVSQIIRKRRVFVNVSADVSSAKASHIWLDYLHTALRRIHDVLVGKAL
jgi:hypothetical protein